VSCGPKVPHPYHAWALMEKRLGRPDVCLAILERGRASCSRRGSVRLQHAAGSVEAELGRFAEAERSFTRGLKVAPRGHRVRSFLHSGLGGLAARRKDADAARDHFRTAVGGNPRHAQGWTAWAAAEEAGFGDVARARAVYADATTRYEAARRGRGPPGFGKMRADVGGDKWAQLYRHWADMERRDGDLEAALDVYKTATALFDGNWQLQADYARALSDNGADPLVVDRTFEKALTRAGSDNADPYRIYGEHEMERDLPRFERARHIFYRGAAASSAADDGRPRGLAPLFHAWAICEWRARDSPPARVARLLELAAQHAAGARGAADDHEPARTTRSWILLSRAQFELSSLRRDPQLAQHFVSMSIVEHGAGGTAEAWTLWGDVALLLRNPGYARTCYEQALAVVADGRNAERLEALRGLVRWEPAVFAAVSGRLHEISDLQKEAADGSHLRGLCRNAPWQKEAVEAKVLKLEPISV